MRFAVPLSFVFLALAGCSAQEETNQQDEDLKAYVLEAAIAACTQQAVPQAQGPRLDIDFANVCECGLGKVFKDIPAGDFAAITSEEDVAAFVARLQSSADKAMNECTAQPGPGQA
jgi:hypothetical protein